MAKTLQELQWVADLLPENFLRRAMFGGFAYYDNLLLKLVIFEGGTETSYRGIQYNFEIWNGCMFPAEKEYHAQLLKKYPFLVNHPILPKWLYLPVKTENFDDLIEKVIKDIQRPNTVWGTLSDRKKKSLHGSKKAEKIEKVSTQAMRKPQMFRDESIAEKKDKIKSMSDFKNLGPATEKTFKKAGITPTKFMKLGWKKTFQKLCEIDPKNNHSIFAYALIGALENKEWHAISNDLKKEAQAWAKKLRTKHK